MVAKRTSAFLPFILIFIVLISASIVQVSAANIQYHVDHEWAKIWINKDGTIDLQYDLEMTCDEGTIRYVDVGQPNQDFTIGEAEDSQGKALKTEVTSDQNGVRVYLAQPLNSGQSVRFVLTTNVGQMIWEDQDNPGNVGMQFIPVWWNAKISDLRVLVLFPQGVQQKDVKVSPNWDNVSLEEDRLTVYWERHDLQPNEKLTFGVSFPKDFVTRYESKKGQFPIESIGFGVFFIIVLLIIVAAIVVTKRRISGLREYVDPSMRMETLGIKYGLTAVEASELLGMPPTKIVVMMLYSLLLKQAVWVTSAKPLLKLKVMEPYKDGTGPAEKPLQYYEKSFITSIKEDGGLDEKRLADTVSLLQTTVEGRLRGYCREDTIAYYKKTVNEAWNQVSAAGTAELASKAYDENLLWLLLDDNFQSRTDTAFRDRAFEPQPFWWWFWYNYGYYHPGPIARPGPETGTTTPVPKIPGSDLANNVATAMEKTANSLVVNIEKFTNSILPPPKPEKTSQEPVHHKASCACVCHSCACVCACVSCACACAGGGVG